MKQKREFRFISKAQIRAKAGSDKPVVEGYAAVFNAQSEELGFGGWSFREVIKPGAFARAIREKQDVRCFFNHDDNIVLGRTKSGTLRLSEDEHGLHFECDMPDTQQARDLHALIERGDIDQCSFGFCTIEDDVKSTKKDDGTVENVRTLIDVDLFDVSPVTFPAYPQTECDARTLFPDGVPAELRTAAGKTEKRDDMCECDCPECEDGDCADCSDPDCDDPNCEGHERSKKPITKTVDGAALRSESFAFVGDVNDSSTWKLPIDMPGDADKTRNHVRNAIARFNHTKSVPDEARAAAWEKIVAAAKANSVQVTEENRKKWSLTDEQFRQLTEIKPPETDTAEIEEQERAQARARAIAATI